MSSPRWGLPQGDSLLVYSALNSIGRFQNKAQILTGAFLQALGPSGTLLMPALSYEFVTANHPFFDQVHTASCVGGLTEFFRNLAGVRRSIHPTHSVCSIGTKTVSLVGKHHLDDTPCGLHSPFSQLRKVQGKILFLGCGLRPNTSMHAIEELAQPEYLFGDTLEYSISTGEGAVYKKKYTTHHFKNFEQRYDRVLDVLEKEDYSVGTVLGATTYLLKTVSLWEKVNEILSKSPLYFVDKKR